MSTVQQLLEVRVHVNMPEAIRRGFGGGPEAVVRLNLATLDDAERDLVAARYHADHEKAWLNNRNGHRLTVNEPTQDGVMEALRADEAERVKEVAEREERIRAAISRVEAASDEDLIAHWSDYHNAPAAHWIQVYHDSDYRRVLERLNETLGERMTKIRERIAADREAKRRAEEERRAEAAAAKAEREAKERAEREAWIREYGSTRLRRLLEEGIEYEAVYRDERLALELPDWRYRNDLPGGSNDPRNPPEKALDLLDEARETVKDARLVYWEAERPCEDCKAGYCDSHDDRYVRGYTCEAWFLGRPIVYRVAEDGTPPVLQGGGND